jgi:hypothetical protein
VCTLPRQTFTAASLIDNEYVAILKMRVIEPDFLQTL